MTVARVYDVVVVEEVHSGDDLVVLVDLGVDGLFKRVRVRLFGVDTPNAYREKSDTEAGGVRDEVRRLTSSGACTVHVVSQARGGWVVILMVDSETGPPININEALIGRGYIYRGKVNHKGSEGTT
jgi:hypothetical protein